MLDCRSSHRGSIPRITVHGAYGIYSYMKIKALLRECTGCHFYHKEKNLCTKIYNDDGTSNYKEPAGREIDYGCWTDQTPEKRQSYTTDFTCVIS